ncbi:MAG TPA: glutaredoxin family protein [Acidiferrobacterales bacterium]|jgi:glutaredoxin
MRIATLMVAVIGLTVGSTAPVEAAKLYKWVDEQGNVSYQDRPPPEGAGSVEEKDVRVGGRYRLDEDDEGGPKAAVTLYRIPKCSPCDAARVYLQQRNVPFTEIDVSNDVKVQEAMKAKVGDLSVPTIVVGGKVMKGFMESLLEGELEAAGYPKAESAEEGASPQQQ